MSFYYEKPRTSLAMHGQPYGCDHPLYNACTVYLIREKGLAVIQQRFDPQTKHTFWHQIDEYLVDDIYQQPGFMEFFNKNAGVAVDGLYPTVTVRQIMRALKMRPLRKEPWETVFDHRI